MKKTITALTLSLLLVVFSTGFVHAEPHVLPEDVNKVLEELEGITDELLNLDNLSQDSQDPQLEEAIEEVLELEEDESSRLEKLEEIYAKVQEKVQDVAEIVERQYNGKKLFVQNVREVYTLTSDLQENLRDVGLEMKAIVKDEERKIDTETYGEIRDSIDNLKREIKENDYIIGEIARETKNYLRLVKNKRFLEAVKSFERILSLQEEQIQLLQIINRNVLQLHEILLNA